MLIYFLTKICANEPRVGGSTAFGNIHTRLSMTLLFKTKIYRKILEMGPYRLQQRIPYALRSVFANGPRICLTLYFKRKSIQNEPRFGCTHLSLVAYTLRILRFYMFKRNHFERNLVLGPHCEKIKWRGLPCQSKQKEKKVLFCLCLN